jgi:eukaryotic-like serine/threonine-protein kinase
VMERLHGTTLRQRLDDKGPLDVADACAMVQDVLSSLSAAHRLGIRHRDLKPANVFLCAEPDGALHAKLMDFGVAKIEGGRHSLAGAVGTPRYFPPERIRDPSAEDHRGDLYAAGLILYEALTGRHPYEGGSVEDQMSRMVGIDAPRLSGSSVPDGVARVVAKALAREPAARWSTADEMSIALAKAYGGQKQTGSPRS